MKFKPTIYISGQWFSLYFKYPKNIRKLLTKKPLEFFENERVWVDGKEKVIDLCIRFTRKFSIEKNWKEPDFILVEAFIKKEKVWFEMYSQQTPIRINENWEITFWFDKIADTLEFNMANLNYPDYENVEFKNIYKCEKFPNPKFAEKTYKYICKFGLCSKPVFDPLMGYYDWKCLFCRGNHWVGNPDHGYVIEKKYGPTRLFHNEVFSYKNRYYKPCKESIYNRLVFYNKEEYQKIENKPHTFNDVWKIEMTQEEIEENGNSIGGAWRDLRNGEIIGRFSDIDKSKYEKVITLGYHTDQPPLNAVPCPVCRDLYISLCRSGYSPLNIFQKLKERFYSLRFIIKHSKR